MVDRDVHVQAVERARMVFDTRFVPALPEPPRDVVVLWFIASGRLRISPVGEEASLADPAGWHHAPVVVRLHEAEFTGANGQRACTLVAAGEPFRGVELRVRATHLGAAVPSASGVVTAPPAVWAAVAAVLDQVSQPEGQASPPVRALLQALTSADLLAPSLLPTLVADEPLGLRVLWQTLAASYRGLRTNSTLKDLAGAVLSTRQAERLLQQLSEQRLMQYTRWRSGLLQLRLGLAALLLSVPELTVKQVADEVGYRNAEALANALHAAGLPAASVIKAAHKRRAATEPTRP